MKVYFSLSTFQCSYRYLSLTLLFPYPNSDRCMWKCHFSRSGSPSVTFGPVTTASPKNFFFLSIACAWFLPLLCRIRWLLTLRALSISFSSYRCLLELEKYCSSLCCEKAKSSLLRDSWSSRCWVYTDRLWAAASRGEHGQASQTVAWWATASSYFVLLSAYMKRLKLFWAHHVLCSVKVGSMFYFRRMVFFLFK